MIDERRAAELRAEAAADRADPAGDLLAACRGLADALLLGALRPLLAEPAPRRAQVPVDATATDRAA